MGRKTWRWRKRRKGSRRDRLSELPDDIILSILCMASLTLKEVARTSILSHRWRNLWRYFPILNFGDSRNGKSQGFLGLTDDQLCQERSNFVNWVDLVVNDCLCLVIDEFTITFDLDDSHQTHIDKWVNFALAKQVKRLALDVKPSYSRASFSKCKPEMLPHNLGSSVSSLTSLHLVRVNVTAEVIECLLKSCLLLENLCIIDSDTLTSIRASDPSLPLKCLDVSSCCSIEVIDISAPKLLSFRYNGKYIEMRIRNACSLSKVSVGSFDRDVSINYALDSLSTYFPQLEYFHLKISLFEELNKGINYYPAVTKLKHLELTVRARCHQSLMGWTRLIAASPVLEKLTLKLHAGDFPESRPIVKYRGRPLCKSLKTLEIIGFLGHQIDIEIVLYVFKHALVLKKVFLDVAPPDWFPRDPNLNAFKRAMELKTKVPPGVKFIVKK